jgi:hypothetical protein
MSSQSAFKLQLLNSVAKKLEQPSLSPGLSAKVLSLYNSIDQKVFVNQKATDVIPIITNVIVEILESENALAADKQELKELQEEALGPSPTVNRVEETQIAIKDFMGINDLTTLQLALNPESVMKHFYITLDTDNMLPPQTRNIGGVEKFSVFSWNYAPTRNYTPGFANSAGEIRDIVAMRLYQPAVHYLPEMNNASKRVSILFQEFSNQAYIGENNKRFHFALRPVVDPFTAFNVSLRYTDLDNVEQLLPTGLTELNTEDFNDNIYHFYQPITEINKISIEFGDPFEILWFPLQTLKRFVIAVEFTCLNSDK